MGVSPELSQLIAGCVWVRRGEVRSQMVRDSCAISHSHLNDFDWRLQVHKAISDGPPTLTPNQYFTASRTEKLGGS